MQRILATVNINMGLGTQNPVLLITRSTNVHELINDFIQNYKLPQSAYDVIIQAIQKELMRENICLESLGRPSHGLENRPTIRTQRKQQKQNIPLLEIRNKKEQFYLAEQRQKKQSVHINRIQLQRKATSPVCFEKQPKTNKISLLRTKSPLIKRDRSPCEIQRSKSPIQNRTPQRERQITQFSRTTNIQKYHSQHTTPHAYETQILSQIFNILTRNQPKTIRVLSPQYVSFTGIKPQALAILQDFFEQIEEHEFKNMDKTYFIGRIRQLNVAKKIIQAVQM